MSLVLALLFHAVLGGVCAYLGRIRLEQRRERWGPPYLVAMTAAAAVGAPVAVFLLRFRGGWFVHHAVEPSVHAVFETYSFAFSLGLVAAVLLATTAGAWVERRAIDRMHPPWCLAPVVGWVLLGVLAYATAWDRLVRVGPSDDALAGRGRLVWEDVAGAASLLPVVAGVVAAWVARRFSEEAAGSTAPPAGG
jgi:hypothetical protein